MELIGFVWAVVIALIAIGMRRHLQNKQNQDPS